MIGKKNPFGGSTRSSDKSTKSFFKLGLSVLSSFGKAVKATKKEQEKQYRQQVVYQNGLARAKRLEASMQESAQREIDRQLRYEITCQKLKEQEERFKSKAEKLKTEADRLRIKTDKLTKELQFIQQGYVKKMIATLVKYSDHDLLPADIVRDISESVKLGEKYIFVKPDMIKQVDAEYKRIIKVLPNKD